MTSGARPRHPDPAGWVRRLFERQVRGDITALNVRLEVARLLDVRGGVQVALEVLFLDSDCYQRNLGALVWPADVAEVAEALAAGADALVAEDLRASWLATAEPGSEQT